MLPSRVRLKPAAISVKRGLTGAAEPAAKRRSTLYESVASQTAYRGQSGANALDRCLEGGHFSWLEETAVGYATASVHNQYPGYGIEASPLCMHLQGAILSHGGLWDTYYVTFRIDDAKQPTHWEAMLKRVVEWKTAVDLGETTDAAAPFPRTKDGFIESLHWKRPSTLQQELLQRLGSPKTFASGPVPAQPCCRIGKPRCTLRSKPRLGTLIRASGPPSFSQTAQTLGRALTR